MLVALLTIGGAGYPVGFLLWSALIPYRGVQGAKAVVEWAIWIPFGGATIAATWWLAVVVGTRMLRRT
jgi:hypothetical protein